MSQIKVTTLMNADGSKQATSSDVIDGATKTKLFSPYALGILAGLDAAALRGSLVAAKSGANSDITSLTGLTTQLSVTQGGTGATSMGAGAVGSVTQSAGVPTGAVVETGSGANGRWTKWADGTMITQHRLGLTLNINSALGSVFYAGVGAIGLPQTFFDIPSISLSAQGTGGGYWTGRSVGAVNATGAFIVMGAVSQTSVPITIDVIAIGRWF